jgi:hypothetical protein
MNYKQQPNTRRTEDYSDPTWEEEEERQAPEPEEKTRRLITLSRVVPIRKNEKSPSDWIAQEGVPFSGWATRWQKYLKMPTPEGTETMERAWRRFLGNVQDRIDQNERYQSDEMKRKKDEWTRNPRPTMTRNEWMETARRNWQASQERHEEVEEKNFWGWAEINHRRWSEGWTP